MGRVRRFFRRTERRMLGAGMRVVALIAERRITRHLDKMVPHKEDTPAGGTKP